MSDVLISCLYEFVNRMPKVELHVHLEGSIKPHTLVTLAAQNKIELPAKTELELEDVFKFKNFQHFVKIYDLITGCLKTADDYELISYQFGCECARQNIRYAEVTFSIFTNCKLTGLPWQEILQALNRGRKRAFTDFGVLETW